MMCDLFVVPAPPGDRLKSSNGLVIKPHAYNFRRDYCDNSVGWNVLGLHGPGTNDRAVFESNALHTRAPVPIQTSFPMMTLARVHPATLITLPTFFQILEKGKAETHSVW